MDGCVDLSSQPLPFRGRSSAAGGEWAGIPYAEGDSAPVEERRLDLYLPASDGTACPLLVWFHGGGLETGARNEAEILSFARFLSAHGVGVASAGYRLSPGVRFPAYVEDAARAVAWVCRRASELGGHASRVFVGGHSAGGYLAALLAMDERFLAEQGVAASGLAGFLPMSGQMMTHFTIRKERGLRRPEARVVADEAAPIFHARPDTAPMLLLVGGADWPGRVDENRYFAMVLRDVAGNPRVALRVIPDRDHGSIFSHCRRSDDPAAAAILEFIREGGDGETLKS